MIKITQGYSFKYEVPAESGYSMVLKTQTEKNVISEIITQNGKYYLSAAPEQTSGWTPTIYKYQLLGSTGLVESGQIEVIQNYLYTQAESDPRSQNEILLEAIQAQIAGKATAAQSSMTVGDKSISYCSMDELFKLRDYFAAKVATEQGKASALNGGIIKYKWSLR